MIGYGSDGAANVSRCNSSLVVLLQKNGNKNLFKQKCTCHSSEKCASEACQALSRTAENLVRNVRHYFAHSYKRKHMLQLVQKMLDAEEHKLIVYASTRWLSLHQVVKRYIVQWDVLVKFFQAESTMGDDGPAATTIVNQLKKPDVKMTFDFLDAILPNFTILNLEMQSASTKIYIIYDRVSGVYRTLLSAFIKPEYLNPCKSLDNVRFCDSHNQLEPDKIYLGGKLDSDIAEKNVL